jgi:hypothetical protein
MNSLRNLLLTGAVICAVNLSYAQQTGAAQGIKNKENMSRELIILRDSINIMLTAMNKSSSGIAGDSTQRYQKASQDLTRYKTQLDKTIDEVVRSRTWNSDIMNRTDRTLSDVRREFKRIKTDFERN